MMMIRHILPEPIYWTVISYIPERVCFQCGNIQDKASWCSCILSTLPNNWAGDDLHELDLFCEACQCAGFNGYCVCFRVREIVKYFNNKN
jgi:hypothetical protein